MRAALRVCSFIEDLGCDAQKPREIGPIVKSSLSLHLNRLYFFHSFSLNFQPNVGGQLCNKTSKKSSCGQKLQWGIGSRLVYILRRKYVNRYTAKQLRRSPRAFPLGQKIPPKLAPRWTDSKGTGMPGGQHNREGWRQTGRQKGKP